METARGVEYGHVVLGIREVEDKKVIQPLKAVIRIATPEDDEREARNRRKEKEAFQICLEKIAKHKLEMKLIKVEYTFDNNKVLFYFTADGRIDFRELVKDLASVFKTRIELRQIGVRDEAKIMGGIGVCGRPLCCATYMPEFVPVSIKMAKEQNLSLNPTKISGVCGRLMCCLKNEEETYEELNSHLPGIGDYVTTPDKLKGEVLSVSVLRQRVKVVVTTGNDEKEVREYPVAEIRFKPKRRNDKMHIDDKELKQLEELEKRKENPISMTNDNERIDDLQRNGYRIIQNKDCFCFGMDAVLLSSFAKAQKNEQVLDLGTGNGVIPILMQAKNPDAAGFTGLEIQAVSADLARRSVELNGIGEAVKIVQGDIKEASTIFGGASFNVVTTNPPYMNENHGLTNPHSAKAIARHELLCTLEDVVREASRCLKMRGRFYMVHAHSGLWKFLK